MEEDALTRLADTLELPHALVEETAVAVANTTGCLLAEARERLARQLEILATVQAIAGKNHHA